MTATAETYRPSVEAPVLGATGRRAVTAIGNVLIAIAVFSGGFVSFEPAPYELLLCGLLVIWLLCGMRISRSVLPLLVLFSLFNFGGLIGSFLLEDYMRGVIYVAVSYFLALSGVFFAIVIAADMGRLRLIFRAYVLAAVASSTLGILGYFGVPGFDMFTRYSRAMGAFQDPNVFSPFLVAPILYLVYGLANRSPTLMPVRAAMLAILLLGLFLAFSRAGWGLAAFSIATFYLLLFINEQKTKVRLKYLLLALAGVSAVVLLLLAALQFDAVSSVFEIRAQAVQDYDGGRIGRFARHLIGYEMALTHPLGVGPLEFGFITGGDPHNIYVKSLMAYGWLGFVSFVALSIWTLVAGFKPLFRQRPWQPYLQIAYVVFLGHLFIGHVIDVDHWRHFYLLAGIIWGCIALEKRHQRQTMHDRTQAAPDGRRPVHQPRKSLSGIRHSAMKHSGAGPSLLDRI